MKRLNATADNFDALFASFCRGRALDVTEAVESVLKIISDVRLEGDDAVVRYTARFEQRELHPSEFEIPRDEWDAALARIDPQLRAALELAAERVRAFHRCQVEEGFQYADKVGAPDGGPGVVTLGQRVIPLGRVGIYVPGGTAAYPSSLIMNAIPARVANVGEVIAVSPVPAMHGAGTRAARPPDAILAAAAICGVDRFFQIGGAQAVAALAYGTASIPRVDKIVGPGNIWVATAKKLCYGDVDIDSVAGPSEVCVVADEHANPRWVAADLLAQAEHDAQAGLLFVTTSVQLADAVDAELARQLAALPREAIAAPAVERGLTAVVASIERAVALADQYAPEHLELMFDDAAAYAGRVRHAGAIFIGAHTPEALGDYVAGPNHVLPTGGSARFFSPLGVYDFVKRTSLIECGPEALRALTPAIRALADAEGLTAHRDAVLARFDDESGKD